MTREQKFFDALRDLFVGAKVEGETGKRIRRIHPDPALPDKAAAVEFEDGATIDLNDLDFRLITPLIWW